MAFVFPWDEMISRATASKDTLALCVKPLSTTVNQILACMAACVTPIKMDTLAIVHTDILDFDALTRLKFAQEHQIHA